jgi:hypothetical protein
MSITFSKRDKLGRPIWYDPDKKQTKKEEVTKDTQKELPNFSKMTKDEINDFASDNGLSEEVNTYMTKKEMISKVKELI